MENIDTKNNRQKFIDNVLELSINSGKLNENAKYILYSEETKQMRKDKINETKKNLCNVIKNVINIADSLQLPIEEILKTSKLV